MILPSNKNVERDRIFINHYDVINIPASRKLGTPLILSVFNCERLTEEEIEFIIGFLKACKDVKPIPKNSVEAEKEFLRKLKFHDNRFKTREYEEDESSKWH